MIPCIKKVNGVEVVELRYTKKPPWKIYTNRCVSLVLRTFLAVAIMICPFQPKDVQNRMATCALIIGTIACLWMFYYLAYNEDRPI